MDNPFIKPRPLSAPLGQRIFHEVWEAMRDIEALTILNDRRGITVRKDMLAETISEVLVEALEQHDKMLAHYQNELADMLVRMPFKPVVIEKPDAAQ